MASTDEKSSPRELSVSQSLHYLRRSLRNGTFGKLGADWKWIWSFSRSHCGPIVLFTLCGMLSSAMTLLSSVASKYLIDSMVSQDLQTLRLLIPILLASAAVSVAFRSASMRLSAKLNIGMRNDIHAHVFRNLLGSQWEALSHYSTGDLLNRFSGDISTVASCAVSWLPSVVIQLFTVVATLAVVLYYDPIMALIAFASTPILLLTSRRLLARQREFQQRAREVSSGLSGFESETFRNMTTLKSFGVEESILRKLTVWQTRYTDTTLAYNRFSIRTNIWLTALGTAVQYLALAYCLWRLFRGDILFGTMTLFLQQRSNLSSAFSSLVSQIPTFVTGSVAASRIQELTQLPKEPQTQPVQPQGCCSLELKQVAAAYADRRVLQDVNLRAPAGEAIALVGPSGEGKSTLMRLFLGLISPQSGTLELIDHTGQQFSLGPQTRHCFAYVPQGNTMLAGTIEENLKLVNEQATEAEMIQALEDACAWDFVSRMPGGLRSPIGEGGKGLSEGQAQRIAIARALLRRAPVLLLDEVTSALDFQTEQQVLRNLMHRGLTCVVATHRSSVLTLCSRIYQVQQGQVTLVEKPDEFVLETEEESAKIPLSFLEKRDKMDS